MAITVLKQHPLPITSYLCSASMHQFYKAKVSAIKKLKRLLVAAVFFTFYQTTHAQTDIVTLSRTKDFINAGLTHIIISADTALKYTSPKNYKEIEAAFQTNTLHAPLYYAVMQKLLQGKFDSATKKFSARVDSIDVNKYAFFDEELATQLLFDTAYIVFRQQYPALLTPYAKDSVYASLMQIDPQQIESVMSTDEADTSLTNTTAATYTPWYGKFQGFVFWLLACVLISVALFLYSLDQIRQLKLKMGDAENFIAYLKEDKEPGPTPQGSVTTVYGEFRNLVTLKIKELYDIIDHLNLRIVALEKLSTSTTSLIENTSVMDDSIDNEGIFYMATPLPGHFPFTARSLKKDSLYKFTLAPSKTEAHYEVTHDGLPLTEVLQDIPKYLQPACTPENDPQGDVRMILTKNHGIAFFDGEKWAIEQKAVIVFI